MRDRLGNQEKDSFKVGGEENVSRRGEVWGQRWGGGKNVKGKSSERGSETSGKGLKSWFRNETDSSNKE